MKSQNIRKKERNRLIWAILISFLIVGWLFVNVAYGAGAVFALLSAISFLVIINWKKIPKKRPDRKMFAFEKDWMIDFIIGIPIGLAVLFIMGLIPGFAIAVPQMPQATALPSSLQPLSSAVGTMVVGVIAPLVEEVFFRTMGFAVFWIVFGFGTFSSIILINLLFALYHIKAYASVISLSAFLAVSNAFISAFLVGILFVLIMMWRGSVSAPISTHGTINIGIHSKAFVVVAYTLLSLLI